MNWEVISISDDGRKLYKLGEYPYAKIYEYSLYYNWVVALDDDVDYAKGKCPSLSVAMMQAEAALSDCKKTIKTGWNDE